MEEQEAKKKTWKKRGGRGGGRRGRNRRGSGIEITSPNDIAGKILIPYYCFYTCQRGFIHIPKGWKAASDVAIRAAWTASIPSSVDGSFVRRRKTSQTHCPKRVFFCLAGEREGERKGGRGRVVAGGGGGCQQVTLTL